MGERIYKLQTTDKLFNAVFSPVEFTEPVGSKCLSCGFQEMKRIFPASLAFEGGLARDFASVLFMTCCTADVGEQVANRFPDIQLKSTKILPGSAPSHPNEPDDRRVQYEGPEIVELWPGLCIAANPEVSTLSVKKECAVCGKVWWDIEGVERPEREVEIEGRFQMEPRTLRTPGMGLLIPKSVMRQSGFLRVDGFWTTFCLESVKNFISENKFMNVSFLEYGELIKG